MRHILHIIAEKNVNMFRTIIIAFCLLVVTLIMFACCITGYTEEKVLLTSCN